MKRAKTTRATALCMAAVLAAAGLATIAWRYLATQSGTINVTAQFDSVAGLYVNNPVSVLGMPVGKITQITVKGGYAEVDFTVDKNIAIPADAKAVTLSTSILTDRHIELTPPYRGGAVLKDHDIIGLTRTRTPVEFDSVLAMMDRLSKSLGGDHKGGGPVADILNTSTAVVSGNGEKMKTALDELSKALQLTSNDGGALTREQMTSIISNASSLMGAAAENEKTLSQFGSSISQISRVLAEEDLGSGAAGRKLNTIIDKAAALLDKDRENLKRTVKNGDTVVQTLVDRKRELAEMFDVLPLMMDNIYNSVDQTNGSIRVHINLDKIIFDNQLAKEFCNLMGLRQLGCSTGTLQDYGPDFGLTYVLDGLAAMGQK
ncbi:Putative Mce family protein [Mycobacteroides abscessus subsp. bolletii]|uniref:MCE family protein n=1 Tax=Mycobacteroides abscessus TaxID=36809 RepID=UPI0009A64330|nr:MCE-family protein Mce6D [Mycobacteroides abscessus subsp. bolletii]SLF40447.1 Putative Mce family protein [Mycobacteroides abscessus subsp. bolletii]